MFQPIFIAAPRQEQRKPPLDIFSIPREHVQKLYSLVDNRRRAMDEDRLLGVAQNLELWRFIRRILPATAGKNCEINTRNRIFPLIEIVGDIKDARPVVGKRGVHAVYDVPIVSWHRTIELLDRSEQSTEADYELWLFLATLVPELLVHDPTRHWHIRNVIDAFWLIHVDDDCTE